MACSQVPKFGDWESEEIPYSICFDNATKGKKSELQNDPPGKLKGQNAPEAKSPRQGQRPSREEDKPRRSTDSPLHPNVMRQGHAQSRTHKMETDALKLQVANKPIHERRVSREEGEMRKITDSPLHNENRHGVLSAGDTPRRVGRQSVGSDRSVDHSPLHPHSQLRVVAKSTGLSSPSWEKKSTSEGNHGLAPSTPGRSRLRSVTRGDDTPGHTPAVPKFGEWDINDPASAEGFTHIFNRVREEKHVESGKVPIMPTEVSYPNGQNQYERDNMKGCGCFPWGKR